jgi:hypothetical protein
MIEIKMSRKANNGNTTLGKMGNKFFEIDTLEDEPREVKVKGETRIPKGRYEIKERKVLSDKTKKYRAKFPWFTWHLELQDVKGFDYIYIHIGNKETDSDGCILVGHQSGDWKIWESTEAFKDLYFYIIGALRCKERVFIDITDDDGI